MLSFARVTEVGAGVLIGLIVLILALAVLFLAVGPSLFR
jgi:hypothetical protein